MVTLIHIIGRQGSGKSGLAKLIKDGLEVNNLKVRTVDNEEAQYFSNDAIRGQFKERAYDFVLIEAEELSDRHEDLQGADKVLQVSVRTLS